MKNKIKESELSYRGIRASIYDAMIAQNNIGDLEFFRNAIAANGEPALENGCGTGRLLVEFVAAGLDVEGLDISPEMLDICRLKAEERGCQVTLHEQKMQLFTSKRRYRTIYIPISTFGLIAEVDEAKKALRRFFEHLEPQGKVYIPLHLPSPEDIAVDVTVSDHCQFRREYTRSEDGAVFRCWERPKYDLENQLRHSEFRYEKLDAGEIVSVENYAMSFRWYTQEQFKIMLQAAGFSEILAVRSYTLEPATDKDLSFAFIGTRH
jgi:ubiquinone/menaquinone biosynthesis C-methylase UbiE